MPIVLPSAPGHQMGTTVQTQPTDLQQRLDAEFAAILAQPLPYIPAPLSPAQLSEGDYTAEVA